ncbi:hypothetical protein [Streptomyces sp. Da 82-17]|uniref:hypothetical protein n=1 Tax=Streptomyces sp. Da 82-17 TaxID=3377116 RepID=UPI0038D37F34
MNTETCTPLTDERLTEIRNRRYDEVTPGPWLVSEDQDGRALVYVERETEQGQTYAQVLLVADWATEADVQFVCSARRSVPELLAEVKRLRAELAARPTRAEALREAASAEQDSLRTDRSRWQTLADALNSAGAIGIDLDGTITDHETASVVWDRDAKRWAVADYDTEAGESR